MSSYMFQRLALIFYFFGNTVIFFNDISMSLCTSVILEFLVSIAKL